MTTVEEIIEKKRKQLIAKMEKDIEDNKEWFKNQIDNEINTLRQTLIESQNVPIIQEKYLDLVERGFIYRRLIDPKRENVWPSSFTFNAVSGNLMICQPDKSILEKPFHVTIIFEPITDAKESE